MNDAIPRFMGKYHTHFTETHSTNAFALDVLSKTNPPEGSCFTADFQSAGRGQIGRSWHSEHEKNLLISYIIYPVGLHVENQFILSVVSSLAVAKTVQEKCSDVCIKWPNDIYIGQKKTAGILIQNVLRGVEIKATVIGIGLNCNQQIFPPGIPNPTSMGLCGGEWIDLEKVRKSLSGWLEHYYSLWKQGHSEEITREYLSLLFRKDTLAPFAIPGGQEFLATIKGIAPDGKLILEKEDKSTESFGIKEVEYIHL
jgi:BirA family biotin operon repressor/biotin-[acetyl-CoA-carboxylase] ligase